MICFFVYSTFLHLRLNLTWQTLLMYISVCQFAARWLLFPLVRESVVNPEFYDNLYFGSVAFSMVAYLAPEVTFIKEPTMEEEEPEVAKKED